MNTGAIGETITITPLLFNIPTAIQPYLVGDYEDTWNQYLCAPRRETSSLISSCCANVRDITNITME